MLVGPRIYKDYGALASFHASNFTRVIITGPAGRGIPGIPCITSFENTSGMSGTVRMSDVRSPDL